MNAGPLQRCIFSAFDPGKEYIVQSNQGDKRQRERERENGRCKHAAYSTTKNTMAISVPSFGKFFNKYNLKKKKKRGLTRKLHLQTKTTRKNRLNAARPFTAQTWVKL